MKKIWEKLNIFRGSKERGDHSLPVARPTLQVPKMQFRLVDDSQQTKRLFLRMKSALVQHNEASRSRPGATARYRYEWGRLPEGREFFYLQPWNEEGLLFEEASKGWIISKAHKVPQSKQFMRSANTWDVVTIFEPDDGEGSPRLSSSRFGEDLLSFPLYEEALVHALPLGEEGYD